MLSIAVERTIASRRPVDLKNLFSGIGFIVRHKILLGAVLLDLFAVLLGNATAVLPIFARDVFAAGPLGFGLLRAAPAAGAILTALTLARWPISARLGRVMFAAVAVFGFATVVLALVPNLRPGRAGARCHGRLGLISVVIRQTMVQIRTPDDMRGRVYAVNSMVTITSNQLGDFRAGAAAALFGLQSSVLLGGCVIIAIVLVSTKLFRELFDAERYESGQPIVVVLVLDLALDLALAEGAEVRHRRTVSVAPEGEGQAWENSTSARWRSFWRLARAAGPPAHAETPCGGDFGTWLQGVKQEAAAQGISQRTIAAALAGVTYDPSIIARDHAQGVFHQSFEQFSGRMVPPRMARAQRLLAQYGSIFNRIEEQFGVPGAVIVAIWGLETDFGANSGHFGTIRSLATLAYDCRRPDKFRGELIAALQIVDRGDMAPADMRGAWAGEIGQTQFLPSSYLKYAVDYDGNGHRDLIHSVPDVLASTANYLKGYGWKRGQPWGEGTGNFQVLLQWNASQVYTKTVPISPNSSPADSRARPQLSAADPAFQEHAEPGARRIIVDRAVGEMGVTRARAGQFQPLVAARGPAMHDGVGHVGMKLQREGAPDADRLHRESVALGQQFGAGRQLKALAVPLIDACGPGLDHARPAAVGRIG